MSWNKILLYTLVERMFFRIQSNAKSFLVFAFGILVGSGITLFLSANRDYPDAITHIRQSAPPNGTIADYDRIHGDEEEASVDKVPFIVKHSHNEGSELSDEIFKRVKIFCWIMTSKNNTYRKAVYVNATWAPHCNKYVFFTADKRSKLPTVELNVTEGRKYLWAKTKEVHKYIYENELDNYDWFLKADDDTFVIIENLRFMLLPYSPDTPIHFGCKFKVIVKQGYMSGGAGYVLSREAVKRFVEIALEDPKKCKRSEFGAEDAELGKCLANVGVIAGDSRDSKGRHRMLPFGPITHFGPNNSLPKWFYHYSYYNYFPENECCSDYVVSFHYINPPAMLTLNYFVYHVRPFGLLVEDWMAENGLKERELYDYAKQKASEYTPLSSSSESQTDKTKDETATES